MVVRLAKDFSQDLLEDELELDSADFVELNNFGEDPLWAIDVTAELESHIFNYNYR